MTHLYNLKTGSLLLVSALLWGSQAQAAEQCKIPPTCYELGYTLMESDCTGKPMVRCPFNSKKVFCIKSKCKTGMEWCEAKGECIESCKGYQKTTNPNMVLCVSSQTKVLCNDCNGNTYYKCAGSPILQKPGNTEPSTPSASCANDQTRYKAITDQGSYIIRSASRCGSYVGWSSGQFPIQMGDTCTTWMKRVRSEIAAHNAACPDNQVTDTLMPTNCNTCCDGGTSGYGILSRCTTVETGTGVLVPQL